MDKNDLELSLTLGLIMRGDVLVLKDILSYIQSRPDVEIIFKRQSARKLFISDDDGRREYK